jgi:Na+/proline symporter
MCANLALFAWIFVPKMQSVLGKTSIASYMSERYGQIVGNTVCILGAICSMGGIGIQFKIMGECLCFFFDLDVTKYSLHCIVLSSVVIIFYTTSGGIRGVVRTDIIQTICFTIAILVGIGCFNGKDSTYQQLDQQNKTEQQIINDNKNQASQYSKYKPSIQAFTNMTLNEFFVFILYLGYFAIPGFKPHVVQRVSMAKDLNQAKKSYYIASITLVIILVLSCYLSYLLTIQGLMNSDMPLLQSLINSYNIPLVKGIFVIGVISMCMSTADSNLNITSILLANDLFLTRNLKPLSKIKLARLLTLIVGLLSIIYAVQKTKLFSIILLSGSFYLPTVSIPIMGTVLGYKITKRCCIATIGLSLIFVVISKFIIQVSFDINLIGMLLNLFILIAFHHIVEKWEWLKPFGINSQLSD